MFSAAKTLQLFCMSCSLICPKILFAAPAPVVLSHVLDLAAAVAVHTDPLPVAHAELQRTRTVSPVESGDGTAITRRLVNMAGLYPKVCERASALVGKVPGKTV